MTLEKITKLEEDQKELLSRVQSISNRLKETEELITTLSKSSINHFNTDTQKYEILRDIQTSITSVKVKIAAQPGDLSEKLHEFSLSIWQDIRCVRDELKKYKLDAALMHKDIEDKVKKDLRLESKNYVSVFYVAVSVITVLVGIMYFDLRRHVDENNDMITERQMINVCKQIKEE